MYTPVSTVMYTPVHRGQHVTGGKNIPNPEPKTQTERRKMKQDTVRYNLHHTHTAFSETRAPNRSGYRVEKIFPDRFLWK